VLIDHQTRIEMANAQIDRLHADWGHAPASPRHTLGTWLIRVGQRLAPERRPSALAHEALTGCRH
jgi:hypothetical protein